MTTGSAGASPSPGIVVSAHSAASRIEAVKPSPPFDMAPCRGLLRASGTVHSQNTEHTSELEELGEFLLDAFAGELGVHRVPPAGAPYLDSARQSHYRDLFSGLDVSVFSQAVG